MSRDWETLRVFEPGRTVRRLPLILSETWVADLRLTAAIPAALSDLAPYLFDRATPAVIAQPERVSRVRSVAAGVSRSSRQLAFSLSIS
jgi:hypothetical protein